MTCARTQVKPELGQSFPGRTKQLWHFDPNYDQGGDQEIHVTYTYYTFLVVGYGWDETFARTGGVNTTGPGVLLAPGEEFSSLSVRTVLQDTNDLERQVRKTHLLRHFILEMIILPRQARDKHRGNTQKEMRFLTGDGCAQDNDDAGSEPDGESAHLDDH